MKIGRHLFYFIIYCFMMGMFSSSMISCSNNENTAQKSITNAGLKTSESKKATEKKDIIQEDVKAHPSQEFTYDATGKTDPFEPLITSSAFVSKTSSGGTQPQRDDVPLTPLQKLDLKELALVAIIASEYGATALIEDSAKNGYIVKEGMHIGKNDGVIKKIYGSSIVVEEKILDPEGALETKVSTLTIKNE